MNNPNLSSLAVNADDLRKEVRPIMAVVDAAESLNVACQADYDAAGSFISECKKNLKKLETKRLELTRPVDAVKKSIMALFQPYEEELKRSIKMIDGRMIAYYREEEKKRRLAEAEAAEKARKEQERLQKRAEQAAAKGREEKAAELAEQALNVVPIVPEPAVTKQTAATTIVKTYKAEVYDKLALIEAIARGDQSMELVDVNLPALNRLASANKEYLKVPGVRVVVNETIRSK